jgi:hypothetical protein
MSPLTIDSRVRNTSVKYVNRAMAPCLAFGFLGGKEVKEAALATLDYMIVSATSVSVMDNAPPRIYTSRESRPSLGEQEYQSIRWRPRESHYVCCAVKH